MSAEKVREYLLTHGVHYEIAEHALAYTCLLYTSDAADDRYKV